MPNWCLNNLRVRGPAADMARFIAVGVHMEIPSERNGLINRYAFATNNEPVQVWCLSRYYPSPPEYEETEHARKLTLEQLRALFGEPSLYMWRVTHWGTKWDCYAAADEFHTTETTFDAQFDSAWSPPVEWLHEVQHQFPTLLFRLDYIEENSWFAGVSYTDRATHTIIDDESEPCFRETGGGDNIFRAGASDDEYVNQAGQVRTYTDLRGDENFEVINPFDTFRADWEQEANACAPAPAPAN